MNSSSTPNTKRLTQVITCVFSADEGYSQKLVFTKRDRILILCGYFPRIHTVLRV